MCMFLQSKKKKNPFNELANKITTVSLSGVLTREPKAWLAWVNKSFWKSLPICSYDLILIKIHRREAAVTLERAFRMTPEAEVIRSSLLGGS